LQTRRRPRSTCASAGPPGRCCSIPRPEPELASARFVIRPLVEDDAPALLDLRDWIGAEDLAALRTRLRGWQSRVSPDGREGWLNWLVVGRDSGEPQGWIQATIREHCAKVAYAVLPASRGAGVAAEALGAVTAWLHEDAGFAVVEADIDPDNHASQTVARRAGFVRTRRTIDGEAVWEHLVA